MKNKNKKGITLIEVLSVIAIISIFAVISYENFASNRHHAEVEAVANEIASLINQTRNSALTGKKVNDTVPACFAIRFQNYTGINEYKKFIATKGCNNQIGAAVEEKEISSKVSIDGFLTTATFRSAFRYEVPNGKNKFMGDQETITVASKAEPNIKKTVIITQYRAYVE